MVNDAMPTNNKLQSANTDFASILYKQISENIKPNFFFSPLSLFLELLLLHPGTAGQSADELKTLLNINYDKSTRKEILQLLKVIGKKKSLSFYLANKIYIQKSFKIKNQFRKTAKNIFKASLENIDFKNASEAAAKMNTWVSKKTNKKIKKLVNPTSLSKETKGFLISTLYLIATWQTLFSSEKTKLANFYVDDAKIISVETMNAGSSFNYGESDIIKAKFLKMFFSKEVGSMVFVLPYENTAISELENQIEDVFLFNNFYLETVHVSLPKFKLDVKLDFKTALKELGVRSIFDTSKADLSNIAGSIGDLFIERVSQKVSLSVNESGIGTAAGTASGKKTHTFTLEYLDRNSTAIVTILFLLLADR